MRQQHKLIGNKHHTNLSSSLTINYLLRQLLVGGINNLFKNFTSLSMQT